MIHGISLRVSNKIPANEDAHRRLTPFPLASFFSWLLESGLSPSVTGMPGTSFCLEASSVAPRDGAAPSSDIMILFRFDPTVMTE